MSNYSLILIFVIFSVFGQPAIAGDKLAGPYPAQVIEVIDGDTFRARVQVWLGQEIETLVRINGIDTPELRSKCAQEKQKAVQAKQRLAQMIEGTQVELHDVRYGKYAGRVLADVNAGDGNSIARVLEAEHLAYNYEGAKRKSWC